jgi:plastocyanin
MEQLRSSRLWVVGAIALGVLIVLGGAMLAQGNTALPQGSSMVPAAQAQDAAPSAPAQNSTSVTISNFAFQPASLQVAVGTTVTWTNQDSTAHTVTSDTGAFDSGQLAPGATFSQTFMTPGTFAYHCQIHPFMTATIVVS